MLPVAHICTSRSETRSLNSQVPKTGIYKTSLDLLQDIADIIILEVDTKVPKSAGFPRDVLGPLLGVPI